MNRRAISKLVTGGAVVRSIFQGTPGLSETVQESARDALVTNREGLHARPVMRFVDIATTFRSDILVTNVTLAGETVNGKSAMEMMLLEATQGCTIRIEAHGTDAPEATDALARLVAEGFPAD